MVAFQRMTVPKEMFPNGMVIHAHPKGWIDEKGMNISMKKVWKYRPGGLLRTRSLMVWDSFHCHLMESVKRKMQKEHCTDIAVIPGGLTSVIQPLDVCLNKPLKDRLRQN